MENDPVAVFRPLFRALHEGVTEALGSADNLGADLARLEWRLDMLMRYMEQKDGDVFPSEWGPPTLMTTGEYAVPTIPAPAPPSERPEALRGEPVEGS